MSYFPKKVLNGFTDRDKANLGKTVSLIGIQISFGGLGTFCLCFK